MRSVRVQVVAIVGAAYPRLSSDRETVSSIKQTQERYPSVLKLTPPGTCCPHSTAPSAGATRGNLRMKDQKKAGMRGFLGDPKTRLPGTPITEPQGFLHDGTLSVVSVGPYMTGATHTLTRYSSFSNTFVLTISALSGSGMTSSNSSRNLS